MTLLALSLPLYLLGLPVLAGLLYLLHRLRIRHRRLEVVTTLFWQEAIEEARARVFVQRFRHPLVYAFLLLISILLWTGFADPRSTSKAQEQSLVLVEGSSLHVDEQSSLQARLAVQDLLRSMPREGRSVIWCGKRERTLLGPGEPAALLEARWQELAPEASPSRLAEIVARRAELQRLTAGSSRLPLHLILVGATALPKQLLLDLPADMRVESLHVPPAADPVRGSDRLELLSLGLAPAESGAWNRFDVLLRLRVPQGRASPELRLELGGKSLDARPLHSRDAQRSSEGLADRFLFVSLPAEGELLRVFVAGESEALGSLFLPRRRVLRVQVEPGLPTELTAVLDADPGLSPVGSDGEKGLAAGAADVLISTRKAEGGMPRLWLNPQGSAAVIRFTQTGGSRGEALLRRRFASLGLGDIDAQDSPDAEAMKSASPVDSQRVRLEIVQGGRRALELPLPLLGEGYNFVQSRAFPLFVAEALRWLAAVAEAPRRVAAGEILYGDRGAYKDQAGLSWNPVGASFHVPAAGLYRSEQGAVLAASLQSALDDSETVPLPRMQLSKSADVPLLFWITILALLALVAEWFLLRTGRMP